MNHVTICVPTYNAEATLRETLESILAQSHRELKVKIFDNASTDRTVHIAREFALRDKRVQVFAHAENVGGEGNFTRCLQAAEGDYTAIFHADDLYRPTMVAEQVKFLNAFPDASAVAVHAATIDDKSRLTGERFLPPELQGRRQSELTFELLLRMSLKYGNFVTCPSVMARSSIYKDKIRTWNGGDFRSSADLDVWLRLSKEGHLGFLSAPLMRYRVAQSSFTVREVKARTREHDLFLVLRHYAFGKGDQRDALAVTARDLDFLQFQEFKDVALRRWNIVKDSSVTTAMPLPRFHGSWLTLLRVVPASRYHMKFFAAGSLLYGLTWLVGLIAHPKDQNA